MKCYEKCISKNYEALPEEHFNVSTVFNWLLIVLFFYYDYTMYSCYCPCSCFSILLLYLWIPKRCTNNAKALNAVMILRFTRTDLVIRTAIRWRFNYLLWISWEYHRSYTAARVRYISKYALNMRLVCR